MLVMMSATAWVQALTILAPPDRLVAPGEFVTLVFRLEAVAPLTVEVGAESTSDWRILRQPGAVQLTPGRSVPVAVTVEVPADAAAFSRASVSLQIAAAAERYQSKVVLTVTELIDLVLEAPREVTFSAEGFPVTIVNRGNGLAKAQLRVRRGEEVVGEWRLQLPPGDRQMPVVRVPREGTYTLELDDDRGSELRRTITVIRFGVPPPEPLHLAGELIGGLGTTGSHQVGVALKGALSDYSTLDFRLDALAWQRSFLDLTVDRMNVRLGGGWRDPFGLGLPAGFGVAGSWQDEVWGLAAALGWSGEAHFAGMVAGSYQLPNSRVAAALGVWEDPLLTVRLELLGEARLSAALDYRRRAWGIALVGEVDHLPARFRAGFKLQNLGLATARFTASADYRHADAILYGDVTWPLAPEANLSGRFGLSTPLPTELPGRLRLGAQLGTVESFARLAHNTEQSGWVLSTAFGVRYDALGLGLTLENSWTRQAADHLNLEGRLAYYPVVAGLEGRLGVRYQRVLAPVILALSGSWNLSEQNLGTSLALSWQEGPWRAQLGAALAYGYQPELSERWLLGVTLNGSYTFTVAVPPEVVAASGGRRLGTLEGVIEAGDTPLPGVTIILGRYRLESDAAGRFRAELPPGRYQLVVDLSTLPIAYRLVQTDLEVVITERATTEVALAAVATTVLRGQVLADRDEDAVPDIPAQGIAARLLLIDSEGVQRLVATDEAGSFEVRGLVPGPVLLRLIELPFGAQAVGAEQKTVQLHPGVATEVTFFVRSLATQVQTFPAQALRIRHVDVEVERLPPGAAPLLSVVVQGEAEQVVVVTADATYELSFAAGVWSGRLALPLSAAPGVYNFTVVARAGNVETSRRGQLVIDPAVPALKLTSDAPVRPGERLQVTVETYFAARSVRLRQPFGGDVVLIEEAPGRWVGALTIPEDAIDAIYSLSARAITVDGRLHEQEMRFRVLAP